MKLYSLLALTTAFAAANQEWQLEDIDVPEVMDFDEDVITNMKAGVTAKSSEKDDVVVVTDSGGIKDDEDDTGTKGMALIITGVVVVALVVIGGICVYKRKQNSEGGYKA